MDKDNWLILDKREHNDPTSNKTLKHRELLMERGAVTTWPVSIEKLKFIIKSLSDNPKAFKGFRFFRIRQIGMNSSSNHILALSGFEFYGTGYGLWKIKKSK